MALSNFQYICLLQLRYSVRKKVVKYIQSMKYVDYCSTQFLVLAKRNMLQILINVAKTFFNKIRITIFFTVSILLVFLLNTLLEYFTSYLDCLV